MRVKAFLTLTFVGTLLAGFMIGTFIEGTDKLTWHGALLGFGVWLTIVGIVFARGDE